MRVDIEVIIEESIRRIEEKIRQADEGFGQALMELIDLRVRYGDEIFNLVMQHVGQEIQERRGRYVLIQCQRWIDACSAVLALDPSLYEMIARATQWHSKALAMSNALQDLAARWALDPQNSSLRNDVVMLLDGILSLPYDSLPTRSSRPEGIGYTGSYSLNKNGFDVVLYGPSGAEVASISFRCNPEDSIARRIHAYLSRLIRRLENQGIEIQLR